MIDKCVESGMVKVLQITATAKYLFKSASLAPDWVYLILYSIVNEDFNQLKMGTENGIALNRPVNIDTIKLHSDCWSTNVPVRFSCMHLYIQQ